MTKFSPSDSTSLLISSEILSQEDTHVLAQGCRSWPYEEAQKIITRLQHNPEKKNVILSTGYGPSGLPHIGTFGEVVRTTMVRRALHMLRPDISTQLICFSDDMDGLRKVPDNIDNADTLIPYLNHPLSRIPDPFGKYKSYAAHNNAMLCDFLDAFGFEYRFMSSTQMYMEGHFDEMLLQFLYHHEAVKNIVLPHLGEERRKNYSPFMPICPHTGQVLMTEIIRILPEEKALIYYNPNTNKQEKTLVTGGQCKLQWKADWAMRWMALNVDYEMAGKDLIDSVKLSGKICKAMHHKPPEGFNYELFLDKDNKKISKSKGNGLSIQEWMRYAPQESLSYFMFQSPRRAKRLYFDVIPKNMDEYLAHVKKWSTLDNSQRVDGPIFHIHGGASNINASELSFSLLLNLVSASNAQNKDILWGFIQNYQPDMSAKTDPFYDILVEHAILYFHDFIAPYKAFRSATDKERIALEDLCKRLQALDNTENIQSLIYSVGVEHGFDNLRDWFSCLYQVLLGQKEGPRFGTFVTLYGIDNTIALITKALNNDFVIDETTQKLQ